MRKLTETDKYCKEIGLKEYEISLIKEELKIKYKGHIFYSIYELDLFIDLMDKLNWEK